MVETSLNDVTFCIIIGLAEGMHDKNPKASFDSNLEEACKYYFTECTDAFRKDFSIYIWKGRKRDFHTYDADLRYDFTPHQTRYFKNVLAKYED